MMEFFVGVAAGLHVDGGRGNRSMLVHPAPETDTHDEYFHWVDQVVQQWTRILDHGPTDPGYAALLARIQTAHSSIMLTHNTLPRLDELLPLMARAVRRTIIRIMNAARGPTPQIDWASNYSWILVGARAMDRGFTIEGLTVTYMPRNVGVGNADTLQQRARFFGYKRPYLGLCRVYLEQATRAVFRRYVEHEEDVRRQLIEHRNRGEHLDEWRRAFLLDRRLRPTRQNVLDLDYMHSIHSDDWVWPRVIYGSTAAENSSVAAAFEATLRFVPNRGNPARTLNQMHDIAAGISLAHVYEGLLWRLKFVGMEDTQKFLGLLLQLRRVLDSSVGANEACDIYRMSPAEVRTRTIRENGAISGTLFQGAAPVSPPHLRGSIYPGDSEIKDSDRVTVQLHRLTALRGGQTVASNVLVPAVWIPARLGRGWFVQDTP